jgi:hypothetical protein
VFSNIHFSGWGDFMGIAALAFAVLYLAIGRIIARKFEGAKAMSALFYITGLTFGVLFVPLQLDVMWFTLGWLVLGTFLAVYGIAKERKGFQMSSFIIGGLSLTWFVLIDLTMWNLSENYHFPWQYLAVTASSIIIMAVYVWKKTVFGAAQKAFKYCAAVNLWFYALFIVSRLYEIFAYNLRDTRLDGLYLFFALGCVATIVLALIYPRIPIIRDKGISVISIVLHSCGIFGIFVLNIAASPMAAGVHGQPAVIIVLATVILVAVGGMGAVAVYDLVRRGILAGVMKAQYLPLMVSGYAIIMLSINLINAYGLSFASFWISAIYVLTAFLWTVLGFVKRYALLRRFGLGLALFAVTKLFLIDLNALTQGWRILSYFVLGAVLVAISYVYQYFSKRLEPAVEEKREEE